MSNILEVKNLRKSFGSKEVLKDISFNLPKGKVIGLVGANGAGKTTLTEIIAGINKPTSGEIIYNYKYNETFKEKIGMQFQDSTYPSGLQVKDLVSFARNLHKVKMTNRGLKSLLDTFQMGYFYNDKVKSLSGGQRQKINILMSILHSPKVVILDELTTGLDISAREEIIKFTKKLLKEKGISAILISHHMHEIQELSDEIIVLSDGKILDQLSPEEIVEKHGTLNKYMIKIINSEEMNNYSSKDLNENTLSQGLGFKWFKKKKKGGKK